MFAKHAGQGDLRSLRDDLTLGLKLVIVIGVPASVGLIVLSEPLTALLFQYKSFDAQDAATTSSMIADYGIGVWAYCGLLIIQRAFFAIDDRQTPMRIGLVAVAINLALNFSLIWPFGARGLAISTAFAAIFQFMVTVWRFRNRLETDFDWPDLGATFGKTLLATTIMAVVCITARDSIGSSGNFAESSIGLRLLRVALPVVSSIAVFAYASKLLQIPEFFMVLKRGRSKNSVDDTESD